ncbi:MAG: hypothetical protein WBP64_03000 [Nitrososphaeraceae archaeon]
MYSDSVEHTHQQLLELYAGIETDLRSHGIAIAPMSAANGAMRE